MNNKTKNNHNIEFNFQHYISGTVFDTNAWEAIKKFFYIFFSFLAIITVLRIVWLLFTLLFKVG